MCHKVKHFTYKTKIFSLIPYITLLYGVFRMPAVHRLADFKEHLLQGAGSGDGIPVDEAGTDEDGFETESVEVAAEVLVWKDTVAVLCVSKIPTIILQSPAREDILLQRGLERVCGRPRRPQSRRRVAVRAEVLWAAKVPRGLEPSWRDWRRRCICEACGGAGRNASLTAFRVGGRGSVG